MNIIACVLSLILILFFAVKAVRNQFDFNYADLSKYRNCLFGVSAIFIAIFHFFYYVTPIYETESITQFHYFCSNHLDIGVDIFLILSGMGLYYSFSNTQISFCAYYKKRILNVYLITLIIDLPYVLFIHFVKNETIGFTAAKWIGLLNWTGETRLAWYSVFVMVLYLFYPILFRIQKRAEKQNRDALLISSLCFACVSVCYLFNSILPSDVFNTIEIAICRVPIFIIGSLFGKYASEKRNSSLKTCLFAVLCVAIFGFVSAEYSLINFRFAHSAFAIPLIIATIALFKYTDAHLPVLMKVVGFFGNISLEYYLVHMAFFYANLKTVNKVSFYLVSLIISIPLAYYFNRIKKAIIKKVLYQEKRPCITTS